MNEPQPNSVCGTCGAPMLWAITEQGKRNPIDPEPVENGNIILELLPGRDEPSAIYVGKPEDGLLFDEYEGRRFKSHFATCPNSRQWRKK